MKSMREQSDEFIDGEADSESEDEVKGNESSIDSNENRDTDA